MALDNASLSGFDMVTWSLIIETEGMTMGAHSLQYLVLPPSTLAPTAMLDMGVRYYVRRLESTGVQK